MFKILLVIFVSVCITGPSFSQEDTDTTETVSDTIKTEDEWDDWEDWEEEDKNEWDMDFNMFEFSGAPTISANYGLYKLEHNDLRGSFAEPRAFQLKLGYTDVDQAWQTDYIMSSHFKYIAVSNITTDLADISSSDSAYETNTWKFALGRASGYGYKMGVSALYFTSGNSLDWTRLKMSESIADSFDQNLTGLFNNTFRFGNSFEAGIRFQIIREISLEADYERSIIFPRHLFWKWLGSAVIENIGQFAIDKFVDEILDSSPYFAPVIGFLLKNGLNYGLYELRKEKMNWPFNSAAPLTYDQFKFGITFVL